MPDTGIIFRYYVLYKIPGPMGGLEASLANGTTAYGWNQELNCVFPACWYILHLPRMGFDVIQMDIELALRSHDEPHNINLVAYPADGILPKDRMYNIIQNPTLLICPDDLYDTIATNPCVPRPALGICRISELSTDLLHTHWNQLAELMQNNSFMQEHLPDAGKCVIDPTFPLTSCRERKIIPLIPLAHQLGLSRDVVENIEDLNVSNHANKYVLSMRQLILKGYQRLAEEEPGFREENEKELVENQNFNGTPLIITLPGTLRQSSGSKKYKASQILESDAEAINIMGYHRSSAKNALYISSKSVTNAMLSDLKRLEDHCVGKIDNKYIWKTLRDFGKHINTLFQENGINPLKTVSQITVFSDFPIGLAILPECTAPLCCIKPIVYRPLTPLEQSFRFEIRKFPQAYMGKKVPLKIAVAECVSKTDSIRKQCDFFTEQLCDLVDDESTVSLVVEDISSIREMKSFLVRHQDAQILVVSAHGTYDDQNNRTALVIGNQMWADDDLNISVPPLVLLSACRVMPRGFGTATVGDMFLRKGALAVLGTLVPVNAMKSSLLYVRLFTDIFSVRNGWSPFRTLDEIWSHIVASNAVHEILSASDKLEHWANTPNGAYSPLVKFKACCSAKHLRRTHIYDDTAEFLGELARQDADDGDKWSSLLDSVYRSTGCFPESAFYQLIGMPENIFFRNETVSRAIDDSVGDTA